MSSHAPGPQPEIQKIVDAAKNKQTVDLDQKELAIVLDQDAALREYAQATLASKEEWEALKRTIDSEKRHAENEETVEDEGIQKNLADLEQQIDSAIATAPTEADMQKPEYRIKSAAGTIGAFFGKASETVGGFVESMGSGAAEFIASFLAASESSWLRNIANWLRGFVEPGAIREAMGKALGKDIASTPEDRGHVQTLRAQYQAKLDAEEKKEETYSFATFYTQKIAELAALERRETYTLADLADIPSAEADAVAADEEVKREESALKVETTKKLTENPNLAYVEAFRDALNSIAPGAIAVVENETIPQIVQRILNAFGRFGDVGFSNFGLEVHGGTLEETDHTGMWNFDDNVLVDWEAKLKTNPVGAIRDFLSVDPAAWESENASAARTFADVRAFMEQRGITPTSITSGKAPEPTAPTAPSEPAEADEGHDFFPIGG